MIINRLLTDFYMNLLGLFFSKCTADGDCSHEIKRRLLLGRKVMASLSSVQFSSVAQSCPTLCLDSILKSRDITLSAKVCIVKAMIFPVVMYGCESWTTKEAEGRSGRAHV